MTMSRDWKGDSWDDARRRSLTRGLAATPAERLAWLEAAIRLAWETGALPRKRTDESRANRSVVMSRVLRGGEPDDGSFDLDFWQRIGAEGIFAAAWEMIEESRAFRGEHGDEPRLQRSVLRVISRGR